MWKIVNFYVLPRELQLTSKDLDTFLKENYPGFQ